MEHYNDYSILIFDFRGELVTESDGRDTTKMTMTDMARYMNTLVFDDEASDCINYYNTYIKGKSLSYDEYKAFFKIYLELDAQNWFEDGLTLIKIID